MSINWPVSLRWGAIELRSLRYRDSSAWVRVRAENVDWLRPWEATSPDTSSVPRSFAAMVRQQGRNARSGEGLSLGIFVDDGFAGQISLNPIGWGSLRSGAVGYWVSRHVAGRGVAPTAVAMMTDHAMFSLGLHRIEVNIRPENAASLRVVEKLGFRDEGLREKYLHIDGQWCDHRTFALTAEDLPQGLMPPWVATMGDGPSPGVPLQDNRFG